MRRRSLCLAWLLGFAAGLAGAPGKSAAEVPLAAHAAGVSPPGYDKRFFHITDGLPEGTVQAFAQTADHFLWIGTTGGLVRFDGANFTVFNHENTPAFRENSVFSLLTARDGSLWIGMEGGGLLHFAGGQFKAFGLNDGLTDTFVRTIAQDHTGHIWIGTNNGLFRLREGAAQGSPLERIDGKGDLPPLAVNAIREDGNGRLWLGGSQLIALTGGKALRYRLPGEASHNRVKSIAVTRDGTVWVGTVSGLHRLSPGADAFVTMPQIAGTVRVLRQTSDGSFWVSVLGRGGAVYRIDAQGNLRDADPLQTDAVLSLFEDSENNVWAGTQIGMMRFSKTPVTLIPLPDASRSDFGSVFLDHTGDLWAGSMHLFRIHDGVPKVFRFPGLGNARVRNVFQDRSGVFWAGTEGSGLYRVGAHTEHFNTASGLANNFVRAMVQTKDGALWIGTDEGVSRLEDGHFKTFGMKDGLAYISIRSMLADRADDLWIGTEQGLSHLHAGVFLQDAAVVALAQEKVWAIHQDATGTLWFGTRNNGLFRFSEGRITHISAADGLPSNSVYQILEDASARLWLSGPSGVSLMERRQLDDFALHGGGRLAARFFPLSDALSTPQIQGSVQSAGALSPSGEVWFPSTRGIVHIIPAASGPELAPALLLNAAVADGRALPADHTISLSPGNQTLEIRYSPIQLRPQGNLRFRYKLEGVDKDWVEAGTRRTAYYSNLPAGTFRFQVRTYATNNPLAYSEADVLVRQEPHFYRTWWFTLCALLAIVCTVFGMHRLKIAQIRRRFAAVLEERSRLAREMHDTLLQGCTGVSVVLEAVSSVNGAGDEGIRQHLVDCAREQMRATINEARDAVWQLRQPADDSVELGAMLHSMARRIAEESGVSIQTETIGESSAAVPKGVARELVMVAREATHNAVLHAGPAKVTVRVDLQVSAVVLTVADDGRGFDTGSIPAESSNHFGLIGMRERALHLGGTLLVDSSPSSGTVITMSIPRQTFQGKVSNSR